MQTLNPTPGYQANYPAGVEVAKVQSRLSQIVDATQTMFSDAGVLTDILEGIHTSLTGHGLPAPTQSEPAVANAPTPVRGHLDDIEDRLRATYVRGQRAMALANAIRELVGK